MENRKIYSIEIFLCNELCFESISWLIFKMEEFYRNGRNSNDEWVPERVVIYFFLFLLLFFVLIVIKLGGEKDESAIANIE